MPEQGNLITQPDVSHDTGGSAPQASAGTVPRIRALEAPFKKTQTVQLEDGDLLIKGVPMLAEGVWTDSAVGTPLFYPAKTLEEYSGNWTDTSGWIRHNGGVPRRATDKVGEAENIRFDKGAVMADVRVYGFTQMGRDLQELIKRKLIRGVSVEHGGDERFNPATRQMEASTLSFYGFAFVNKGACKVCRLNEQPQPPAEQPSEPAAELPKETPALPAEDIMDTKELEAKVDTLTKELETVRAQKPVEVKAEIPKELADLPAQMKELTATVKELASRPAPAAAAPVAMEREPGAVESFAVWNPKDGILRGA